MNYRDLPTGELRTGRNGGDPFEVFSAWLDCRPGDESKVPCNGCHACCYHAGVDVAPERDKLEHLDTEQREDGTLWLRKREDGACVHLGENGCTIYEHRPNACRAYDCRLHSLTGVLDTYDGGHTQPVWIFDTHTPESRAFLSAATMLGQATAMNARKAGEGWSAREVSAATLLSPKLRQGYEALLVLCRLPPKEALAAMGLSPEDVTLERLQELARGLNEQIEA